MTEKEFNEQLTDLLERYSRENRTSISAIFVNWMIQLDGKGKILDLKKETESLC